MASAEDNLEAAYAAWNSQKLAINNTVQEYDQQLQLKQTHDLDGALRAVYPLREMDRVKYLLDKMHVPYVELDTALPNWPDPFSRTTPVQTFTIPVGSVSFESKCQDLLWYITPNSIPTVNGYGMCVVSTEQFPRCRCPRATRTPAGYVNEFSDYPFQPVDQNLKPPYLEFPPFNWKGKPADPNDPEFQAYLHQQFSTSVSGPVTDEGLYDIYGINYDSYGRSRVNPAVPGATPEQVGENEIITPIRINQKHRRRFTFTAQKMWNVIALFSPRQQIVVP